MKKNYKDTMVGKATYREYEDLTEVWSYNTLLMKYYRKLKCVEFFPNYNINQTTGRHLNKFFTDYVNAPGLASGVRRSKAILSGKARIDMEVYEVRVNET